MADNQAVEQEFFCACMKGYHPLENSLGICFPDSPFY